MFAVIPYVSPFTINIYGNNIQTSSVNHDPIIDQFMVDPAARVLKNMRTLHVKRRSRLFGAKIKSSSTRAGFRLRYKKTARYSLKTGWFVLKFDLIWCCTNSINLNKCFNCSLHEAYRVDLQKCHEIGMKWPEMSCFDQKSIQMTFFNLKTWFLTEKGLLTPETVGFELKTLLFGPLKMTF